MTVTTIARPTTGAHPQPYVPVAASVRQGVGALSLSAMTPAEVWGFCERLADTPLLPDAYRRNPSSILWALEYGRALNLDVVTTITTIHVIKGKPSQSADLMLSRTRAAGHRVRIRQAEGSCTVSIRRSDDPEFENAVTWTYDDAVRALLCTMRDGRPYSRSSKGEPQAWEKYPRAMLRARAISECVRSACPEVLHGAIYTPEELGAVIDQDGNPLDVQPQLQRQAPGQDAWEQATPAPVVQQTPPDVVTAGVADVPPESLTPAGRDYLHEAMAAPDAATVRLIWQDARAEGARPEYLDQIAEVGKGKAFIEANAPQLAEQPQAPSYDAVTATLDAVYAQGGPQAPAVEPVADTPQEPTADARAQAEERLRGAASRAQLTTLDADFQRVYGKPIESANAQQLDTFRARIENAGGAQ